MQYSYAENLFVECTVNKGLRKLNTQVHTSWYNLGINITKNWSYKEKTLTVHGTNTQTNQSTCPIPIFMVPALHAGPFQIFTLTTIT